MGKCFPFLADRHLKFCIVRRNRWKESLEHLTVPVRSIPNFHPISDHTRWRSVEEDSVSSFEMRNNLMHGFDDLLSKTICSLSLGVL